MKQHLCPLPTKSLRRAAFPRIVAWLAAWMLTVAAAEAADAQTNKAANKAADRTAGKATDQASDKAPPEHYRQDCIACHGRMTGGDGEPLYRRKDRLVGNYAALVERVAYCRKGTDAIWSKAQEEEVVRYLNRRFYRFEEPGDETPG